MSCTLKIWGVKVSLVMLMILAEIVRMDDKKVYCHEFNEDLLQNVSCTIKLKNRHTQLYSINIVAKPDIYIYNLKMKMTSYYKFRTVVRPIGIKLEEDVCEFLMNINSSLLLSKLLFKNVPDDLFKPCPLSGTRSVKNFELSYYRLPDIIPTGEYRFDTTAYTTINGREILVAKVQNFFECSEIFYTKLNSVS